MKKFIFLFISIFGIIESTNAQEMDSPVSLDQTVGSYNLISAGYDLMFLNADETDDLLNGFNVQLVHGFKLSEKVPLYLETGIGLTYNTFKYIDEVNFNIDGSNNFNDNLNVESSKKRLNSLRVYIPLSIGYRFGSSPSFSFLPYTGFSLSINPIFDYKFSSKSIYVDPSGTSYNGMMSVDSSSELGNIRWQVGLKFMIQKIFFGAQYNLDVIPLATLNCKFNGSGISNIETKERLRTANLSVSIGYVF